MVLENDAGTRRTTTMEERRGFIRMLITVAVVALAVGAAAMRNHNDVNMVWTAANQGLSFSLAQAGLYVKLTEGARALAAKNRTSPGVEGQPAAAPRSPR